MSKSAFFAKQKQRRFSPIEIKGLESVRIRSLSSTEKATLLEAWWTGKNEKIIPAKYEKRFARWVQVCIVDDDGELVFDESDLDDLVLIDAAELERLSMACIHFNGCWDDPKNILEGTEKNSESRSDSETTSD